MQRERRDFIGPHNSVGMHGWSDRLNFGLASLYLSERIIFMCWGKTGEVYPFFLSDKIYPKNTEMTVNTINTIYIIHILLYCSLT